METFLIRMLEYDTNANLKNSSKFEGVASISTSINRLSRNRNRNKRNPNSRVQSVEVNAISQTQHSHGNSRSDSVDVNHISQKPHSNGKRSHSFSRNSNKNLKHSNNTQNANINRNKPPMTCGRCFSRENDHQITNCPSRLWCSKCQKAIHNTEACHKR